MIVHTGYTPLNFTGISGTSYVVTPQDDENAVFDHWEDQSRDRIRTIVLDADASIVAHYDKNVTTTPTTPTINPSQDKGDESDEGDDDDKAGDNNKKQKKEKRGDDDDGGNSKPNGPTGSWLLPLEKEFEGLMQLIRSTSWWNA
jgi:hypothetical protein